MDKSNTIENMYFIISLVISAVALIQPYLWLIYKRYISKPYLEIYPKGGSIIELGFSNFGATVGFMFSIRSTKSVFIKDIKVNITKLKDTSKHEFEWIFSREEVIKNATQEVNLTMAECFYLNETKGLNLIFRDTDSHEEIQKILQNIILKREKFFESKRKENSELPFDDILDSFRKSIQNDRDFIKACTNIDRTCYWNPGDYELEINIETVNKKFSEKIRFCLDDKQKEELILNTVSILQNVLFNENYQFNCVYTKYDLVLDKN